MKLAICDDLHDQIELMRTATEYYFSKNSNGNCEAYGKLEIDTFDNSLIFLENLNKKGCYDIVLLDICMPGIIGTDVAKEIRHRKDKTEIIFLTTSNEFAVDAFALKAAHYLVKPFTQNEFDEAMDRAMIHFLTNIQKNLTIKTEGGSLRSIDINDIQYIESCAHGQTIHMTNGELVESRRSLARLLEELKLLSSGQFISPYKGYIVNQKAIATIKTKSILLHCGATIPIPRGSFREIQSQYFTYQFEGNGKRNGVLL